MSTIPSAMASLCLADLARLPAPLTRPFFPLVSLSAGVAVPDAPALLPSSKLPSPETSLAAWSSLESQVDLPS